MSRVRIAEVTAPIETWNPQASGSHERITYVDIASIDSSTKTIVEPTMVAASEAPSRARQLLKAGDVIVSTVRPGLNAVAFVTPELDGATASTGFCVLRPDADRICGRYLFHCVRTVRFVRHLEGLATGASYPAVSDRTVRESSVPLPRLAEQRRIADLLDLADAVRRKREESRRLVDELLRSVFLEMFGDPVRNEKGWDVKPLGELAIVERGRFTPRPRNDPRFYGGEFPFIQTGDIARSAGRVERWTQTLNHDGAAVSRAFPSGTIAVAIAANVGDAAVVGFPFCCPDSVVGINPFLDVVETEFLLCVLHQYKPILQAMAPQTAQANINLGVLRPLGIPVPPIGEQQRFSAFVATTNRLADRYQDCEHGIESLGKVLSGQLLTAR